MGVAERYNKKQNKDSTTRLGVAERYELRLLEDEFNSFITTNNNLFTTAEKDSKLTGYRANSQDWYNNYKSQVETQKQISNNLKNKLQKYSSYLDDDFKTKTSDYLSSLDTHYTNITDFAKGQYDYYSKFKDEDDYKKAVESQKVREEQLVFDTKKGQEEIDAWEKILGNVSRAERILDIRYGGKAPDPNDISKAEWVQYLDNRSWIDQYGSSKDVKSKINEKKGYLQQAKWVQENANLNNVGNPESDVYDPNFDLYVEKGNSIPYDELGEKKTSRRKVGRGRPVSVSTIDDERAAALALFEHNGGSISNDYSQNGEVIDLYRQMEDEEFKTLAYWMGYDKEHGTNKTKDYLDVMELTLADRKSDKVAEDVKGLELAFGVVAGFDQFVSGVENIFNTEDDYITPSVIQLASGKVRENLAGDEDGFKIFGNSIGQIGYDFITTTSNMLPSIAASAAVGTVSKTAGAALGASLMGASSAGNAYQDMLNAGYDKSQARTYSTLVGLSEAGLQYALGGISKFGGNAASKFTSKTLGGIAKGINKASIQFAVQYGGQFVGNMISEGFEEGLQEVLDPFFRSIATGEKPKGVDWEQVAYSGMLGALSAGVLDGIDTVATRGAEIGQARDIKKEGNWETLKNVGKTFSADSIAYKIADKVNEKTGAYKLSMLLHDMNANLSEQNRQDIEKALVDNHIAEENAKSISKWLGKAVDGGNLTKAQQMALEDNPIISRVFRDVIIDKNSTVNQRLQGMMELNGIEGQAGVDLTALKEHTTKEAISNKINIRNAYEDPIKRMAEDTVRQQYGLNEVANRGTESMLDSLTNDVRDKADAIKLENAIAKAYQSKTPIENAIREGNKVSEENGVSVKKITSIGKDGKMMVETDNGTVEDANDIQFKSHDNGVIILATSNMATELNGLGIDLDVTSANAVVNGYTPGNGISAVDYMDGAKAAIRYGVIGQKRETITKDSPYHKLTKSQQDYLYKIGRDIAENTTNKEESRVKASSTSTSKKSKNGKVTKAYKSKLNPNQATAISTVEKMSEVGILKNNFYFFESKEGQVNIKGKYKTARVFTEDVGVFKAGAYAPNGIYQTANGDIYIDINSGASGEGLTLYTLAHELGHFVKHQNPTGFKVLADFVSNELGGELENLIQNKLDLWRQIGRTGKSFGYMDAYEDVICDALEPMFTDGNLAERLVEKAKTSIEGKSLLKTLKKFFSDLYKRIQQAYAKLNPQDPAAVEMKKHQKAIGKVADLFAEAIVGANENFDNADIKAQKNTIQEDDVKLSDRDFDYWLDKIDTISNEDALKTRSEITYLRVADTTPNILQKYGALNLPLIIRFDAMYLAQRSSGAFEGHYHHLGKDVMGKLLDYVSNPDVILKTVTKNKNGEDVVKLTTLVSIPIKSGEALASIEINTLKDKGEGDELYNLVVTFFDFKENYLRNLFVKYGAEIKYKKETLSQDNPKLHEWLGTIEESVSKDSIRNPAEKVKKNPENSSQLANIDTETKSVSSKLSERTWTNSEYVAEKEKTAKAISEALGVTTETALKYIDDINSVARLIADDRVRLDYDPNIDEWASVLKPNKDYKYTVDMSTLCAKRLLTTGTFDAIQRLLPNTVFDSDDIVHLREMMLKRGYEVACGICYVESTRREMGAITQEFIERYKKSQKTGKPITRINSKGKEVLITEAGTGRTFTADKSYTPTLAELNTTDIDLVKRDHREVYDAYLYFMNSLGQAKPKLLETRTEYKGEILKHFKGKNTVTARNNAGGLRLQSFSDFEVPHLIDMMQIIMDMSRVGLKSQAYTKVPAFAKVFGATGVKINLSLIAKGSGLDSNGKLIFDDVEGMNHEEAFKIREKFSKNVGTVLVGKTDAHIIAAMADPRIDYIIPFHKSSWKESLYDALGLTGYDDYTSTQNEKGIDGSKVKNYDPSEYWDFTKSGDENARIYLEKCRKEGRIPKFPQFQGYPGYWKLLTDFKMYDNDGIGSPQEVVRPTFEMDAANEILNEYKGGHRSFPVAKDVVEDFVNEYKKSHKDAKYSIRNIQPITETEYKDIEKHFGTTGNFRVAGYLLTDGKLLDFSGKHWGDTSSRMRQVDHRDVQEVLNRGNNGINDMVDMIGNGNIRLMPEIGGINLAVYPNEKQRRVLSTYINYMLNTEGGVIIDYDAIGGDTVYSKSYGKTATSKQILNDIRNYFNGARQSELMSFHAMGDDVKFSDRDYRLNNRYLLANALESTAKNNVEREWLANYKEKIASLNADQKRLDEINAEIKRISFTKGSDRSKLTTLNNNKKTLTARITRADKKLLEIESAKVLKNVLEVEKKRAVQRAKDEARENLKAEKEKSAQNIRELMNRYTERIERNKEGRDKTALRHKIKKVVKDLNKLLLTPTKERHIPEEMRVAVAEALSIVNMDTVDAENRVARLNELISKATDSDIIDSLTERRDRILNQGNKLAEKLDKLKSAYEKVRDSKDDSLKSMYDDVIYNKIVSVQEEIKGTSIRKMTLKQLESVYELYTAVLTTVRDSNKAFAENLKLTRQQIGSNVFAEIKDNNKARKYIKHPLIEKFGWKNLKPVQAMKTIGSAMLQKLWNNVLYGQEVFAQDYDEAVKFAKGMKEKHGYDKWDLTKLYSFKSKSGEAMEINLEQMMSIYAYSKRKQADDHIEKGGILLNESIIKKKEKNKFGIPVVVEIKVNDHNAHRLDKVQVGKIIATLEQEFPGAKEFVDDMQTYLSDVMGEKGNEVSMKMYGIKLFKEEHYFPLKSSKDFMEAANAKLKGDVKIKNKGMTKAVVEHASNPIVLEGFLDVWGNHVNEMAMYHGLVLPLEDFSRALNYGFKADEKLNTDAESVKTALGSAFGENADNYLNELLKAINGGVLHDSTAEFSDKMLSRFKKAKVMASLSVVVQQLTAIIRTMGIIEFKYFTSQNFQHKKTWEELKKYCPTAIIKETGSFDTNMGRTIVDMVKDEHGFIDKATDFLAKAPAYMDEMGWNMIWRALKNKVAIEQKLSGEELLKECGKQMTLIINETQVYDSVMARSEMMRSKNTFTKMATSFMAEPTTVANMIYGAVLDVARGKKKIASKTVAAVIASVVINGLVSASVYALRDDDEDETYLEKYISSATTEVLDGLNPLTYLPIVKDVYSLLQGYSVERTDLALIGDLIDAVNKFYKVLDSDNYEGMSGQETSKFIYDNTKQLVGSICDVFVGLPVSNITRDIEAIYDTVRLAIKNNNASTYAGTKDAFSEGVLNTLPTEVLPKKLKDKIHTATKSDDLYNAIVDGDTANLDRLKKEYKDSDAYKSAVRKALKENDPRIKEAAEAKYNGYMETFKRIVLEIKAEGHFSQDDIVSAVNSTVTTLKKEAEEEITTEWYNEETEETQDEESSVYTNSDVNDALERGDVTMAKEIINDIVDAKVKSGKTESEAKSSIKSSITSYWKDIYLASSDSEKVNIRKILYSTKLYSTASEVVKLTRKWEKDSK